MIYPLLMDVIKYTVAGLCVVALTYYLIKPHLDRAEKFQLLDLRKAVTNQTLPLKLQAYERVVLFIERVNPANMLIRLNANEYSASELHSIVVAEIRNEYQHNVTQQIYVSPSAWAVVKRIKDDTTSIVTNAVKGLPEDASGLDLSRTILTHLSTLEENPYDIAAVMVRRDLDDIL
ncbi:hypothetical protein BEL04_14750 [Mucilaginibacter sp. PPCGB 2223]|uniref:DUF7935 family protein n=1 Tax=Mucilaginibacter sp. PPCGB 2223 TaxID=1886027 RepID=UPI000826E881|nr:hypothetical protein [Mucilaginibacter sp. PPCGB 2223]OCX51965.1 hypothetical protein BEL04_14750 [Mucilaginibacter sp. PPCGB 2223]